MKTEQERMPCQAVEQHGRAGAIHADDENLACLHR
jgi:hypothetical protein